MKITLLILAIFTMLVGGLIYVSYRNTTLYMFGWFSFFGLDDVVYFIRNHAKTIPLSKWIIYSLPQALWCFSGLCVFHAIWNNQRSKVEQFYLFIVFLMASIGEIGQLTGVVPGTFDIFDLLLVVISYMTAQFIFYLTKKDLKNEIL